MLGGRQRRRRPRLDRAAATVVLERVVDGDTIAIDARRREERVRYIGDGHAGDGQAGHAGAVLRPSRRSHRNARAARPRRARACGCVFDRRARDRYGRLLAYVYRAPDGLFVNAELRARRLRPHARRSRPTTAARRASRSCRSRPARPAAGCGAPAPCSPRATIAATLGLMAMKMRQSLAQLEQAFPRSTGRPRAPRGLRAPAVQPLAPAPPRAQAQARRGCASACLVIAMLGHRGRRDGRDVRDALLVMG